MQKLKLLVAAAVCVLSAANASAAISYTAWQTDSTGVRRTGGAGDTNLTFNQFDATLGTLHNVEFKLDGTAWATYSYTDLSGSTNNFQFLASETIKIADPTNSANSLAVAIPNMGDIARTVAGFGNYSVPGYPDPILGLTGTNSSSVTCDGACLTSALATYFTGSGTVDLLASGAIANNTTSDNDNNNSVISRWQGDLAVRYSYEAAPVAVPEPASLALVGLGIAGIALSRRRRA